MELTASSAPAQRTDVHPLGAGILLGALLFVPGALGYLANASSFTPGTILAGMVALVLVAFGRSPLGAREIQNALLVAAVVAFVVLTHLLLAIAINGDPDVDVERALLSLLLLAAMAIIVPAVRAVLMPEGDGIAPVIKIVCGLFVVIALLAIAQIQPPTASTGEKPTFPYTEPSFLGFSFPAILIFTAIRSSLPVRTVWIVAFLGLAYALGNLTIIAACLLAAATVLPFSWLAIGALVGIAGSAGLELAYYTDRLDFDWANSTNLSALVYVQGWQMLQEALEKSFGWGIGFQQLGIVYTNVPASVRINALLGHDANLQDGGFILSKLGGELGVLGLGLVAVYLYFAAISFLRLRRIGKRSVPMTDGELFARCCVIGYSVEMVIRGTSYFSGTFVLLLAGMLFLTRFQRTRREQAAIAP